MSKSLVDVIMVTYNQEQYIVQAIESVLMQKTDFSFSLIIGEDCSTDNTRNICIDYAKKYPDKIKLVLHAKNQGLVKNYLSVLEESNAVYIAILEGDDFWTDELKLQKQVDILNRDKSIGLVHANYNISTNNKIKVSNMPNKNVVEGSAFENLFARNFICPLTAVFRKSLLDKYVDFEEILKYNYSTIDLVIWLELSYNSKVKYLDEEVGCYRKEIGSISNPDDFEKVERFYDTIARTREFIASKYNVDKSLINIANHNFYYGLLLKSIHYKSYNRTSYYVSLCKPDILKEKIKCFLSKNLFLIKLGSAFRIFN